jgi:GTPase SAR1 family protein
MGACCEKDSAEASMSRQIDSAMNTDAAQEADKVKLLLLGAGESGKSTIFKQMRQLHGVGYTDQNRRDSKSVIHSNAIQSIQTLLHEAREMEFEIEATEAAEAVDEVDDEELDPELAEQIAVLWEDPGIQEAYENRSLFQLIDSAAYYLKKVRRIAEPDYLPSFQDVLRSRVRTSGIVRETFVIKGVDFEMYDVGGQRNERKKWIHCFDGVTAIIFVAAISEYDQVLFEDRTVNRIDEAVQLFEEVYHNPWFRQKCFILFLNKSDLFEDKLKIVDIRHRGDEQHQPRFLNYELGTLPEEEDEEYERILKGAQQYMTSLFLACADQENHPVFPYVTCATDTDNISRVFDTCKEIILRDNVIGSGFMG